MPHTRYTIKHESLGPGPTTYLSSIHQSDAFHALSNPITIFLDPPSNSGIQLSPLVSSEPSLPLEEIPQAINLIPHRLEVTRRHQFQARPCKSIEQPGGHQSQFGKRHDLLGSHGKRFTTPTLGSSNYRFSPSAYTKRFHLVPPQPTAQLSKRLQQGT